jgi:hypothetical protein
MKYMLMMNIPPKGSPGESGIMSWPAEDRNAHMAFMHRLNKELRDAGELVDLQGLDWPNNAKVVRADKDGKPLTDGPFAETKEFLIGYWIVEVASAERAYEIAAKASAAPGRGGAPLNMPIEVRQVMSSPDPA